MSSNQGLANIFQKLKCHVEFLIELFCTDVLSVTELLLSLWPFLHQEMDNSNLGWIWFTVSCSKRNSVFTLEMYCYLFPSGHIWELAQYKYKPC